MSNINDSVYDIKDLYIVKLNEKYVERKNDDYIQYFNKDLKFIVEKFNDEKTGDLPYYVEYYMECITEQDLSNRRSKHEFTSIPNVFSSIEEFPSDYLTEEEKQSGKITTMRLFQIFQEINVKSKVLTKEK